MRSVLLALGLSAVTLLAGCVAGPHPLPPDGPPKGVDGESAAGHQGVDGGVLQGGGAGGTGGAAAGTGAPNVDCKDRMLPAPLLQDAGVTADAACDQSTEDDAGTPTH